MHPASQMEASPAAVHSPFLGRVWIVTAALVLLVLLALLPPYLNVNRFQRRITQSISDSLGRPVHLDHVTLNLLPVPGFTLDRFVVSEDPAFGAEPTIRAESVRATLRVSTLWRRRVEFATISLTEPSVNLVHLADGRWNVDSILLQTARLDAAPTAQRTAGPAARFPYIQATGARVNLKMDQEKTPVALTEADFAMWLPSPERWNFRIKARPTRTDVPVGYTGLLRLEGTLGRAPTLNQIPIDLKGEWRGVPLGEVSRIVLGRDGDWRGDFTFTAAAQGTVGSNHAIAHIRLADARRADFVPEHLLSLTAECTATVTNAFHGFSAGLCRTPDQADPPLAVASGALDDVRHLDRATGKLQVGPLPATDLVSLLHTLSPRVPPALGLDGVLRAEAAYQDQSLSGTATLSAGALQLEGPDPIALGDAVLHLGAPIPPEATQPARRRPASSDALLLQPTTLALGAREPALLEGRLDRQGYTLHLTGAATVQRLLALGNAIPQFGDGLQAVLPPGAPTAPIRLDHTATRLWNSPQVWQAVSRPPAPPRRRGRRPR